jgi:hypothetical protein
VLAPDAAARSLFGRSTDRSTDLMRVSPVGVQGALALAWSLIFLYPNKRAGSKILRKPLIGEKIATYYPNGKKKRLMDDSMHTPPKPPAAPAAAAASIATIHPCPQLINPLFNPHCETPRSSGMAKIAHKEWFGYKTDLELWRENRLNRMHMRGNPPTKKGEGKRAQQKKKK